MVDSAYAVPPKGRAVIPHHQPTGTVFQPEQNPYQSILVDVTHRCNMRCRNCYIPNRQVPDMDARWLFSILGRLPRRTRIRLVGAEPTVRRDLPDLIRQVRRLGHLPIVMTNGLKLADRRYLQELKRAGLRTVYLSFNGGFDDGAYAAIDDMRCAARKQKALENLLAENMYVSLGMIVVRGVNEHQIPVVIDYCADVRQIYELHLRSNAPYGRHMDNTAFDIDELKELFAHGAGIPRCEIRPFESGENYVDFKYGRLKVQLTQWPDLGSHRRGRLAPDGTIQPFFEHMIANQGGY